MTAHYSILSPYHQKVNPCNKAHGSNSSHTWFKSRLRYYLYWSSV